MCMRLQVNWIVVASVLTDPIMFSDNRHDRMQH